MYLQDPFVRNVLIVLIVSVISIVVSKVLRKILDKYFDNAVRVLKGDPTNYNFFKNAVTFLVFLVGTIIIFRAIPKLQAIGNTLVASAGILAAVVGFASQQAFSNIVGGVFIVIFKPIRVGDVIKVGNEEPGIVEDITLRHTVIKNYENRRIVIPNSTMSSATILNSSIYEEKICIFVEVSIAYHVKVDRAMEVMRQEIIKHPDVVDNRSDKEKEGGEEIIVIKVIGWGESSINLRAYVWSKNHMNGLFMKFDLLKNIKDAFDDEAIEIPYPYRNIIVKKGELTD